MFSFSSKTRSLSNCCELCDDADVETLLLSSFWCNNSLILSVSNNITIIFMGKLNWYTIRAIKKKKAQICMQLAQFSLQFFLFCTTPGYAWPHTRTHTLAHHTIPLWYGERKCYCRTTKKNTFSLFYRWNFTHFAHNTMDFLFHYFKNANSVKECTTYSKTVASKTVKQARKFIKSRPIHETNYTPTGEWRF